MKRGFLWMIGLLGIAMSIYAAERTAPAVARLLERAVANEYEAAARYDAFAAKATAEGYLGAASIFKAQAAAERVHAARFAKLMTDRGLTPPAANPPEPTVWATQENLRVSASNETAERDGIYKEAIDTARGSGDTEVATAFDNARDSEVEHANLCANAARNLGGLKDPKAMHVCNRCGYTTDVKLPLCPVCRADKSHVEDFD